jgi:hypothetical protein
MDHLSSSSPQRDDAASQDDEIEQIASHMVGDDESGVGVESRDDEGPKVGHGAWVEGQWHDPIDPHSFAPRESR